MAENGTGGGTVGYQWKSEDRAFARRKLVCRPRDNGTPLRTTDPRHGSGALVIDTQIGCGWFIGAAHLY